MSPGVTVLVDFDGTLCLTDIGNRFFDRFTGGAFRAVVDSWKRGEISSRRCLIGESSLARATREDLLAFAREQPVDPAAPGFLAWARERGWTTRVVSDGLDGYIRAVLDREGIDLEVQANRVVHAGDRILPAFPYAGRGCGECGNCKRGAVDEARPDTVVFIGDGMSDRCGARVADRVFARAGKDLARFCREEGIPHTEYDDFGAVRAALEADPPAPPTESP